MAKQSSVSLILAFFASLENPAVLKARLEASGGMR
jgi:hypothetical protein